MWRLPQRPSKANVRPPQRLLALASASLLSAIAIAPPITRAEPTETPTPTSTWRSAPPNAPKTGTPARPTRPLASNPAQANGATPSLRTEPAETAAPARRLSSDLPTPPDTGTPTQPTRPGTTRGGGRTSEAEQPDDRSGAQRSCGKLQPFALVADSSNNATLAAHPTFWFYLPYAPAEIAAIDFEIRDEARSQSLYRTAVDVGQTLGMVSVSVPTEAAYRLRVDDRYRWSLRVRWTDGASPKELQGTVVRQEPGEELVELLAFVQPRAYIAYKANGLWYDAIDNLAQLYLANPDDPKLQQEWREILEELGHPCAIEESTANFLIR